MMKQICSTWLASRSLTARWIVCIDVEWQVVFKFLILEVLTYLQSQILPMFNSTHHHNIKCSFKSSIQFCIKESQTELCNKFDFSFQFLSCLNSHFKKLFRPQLTFMTKFTLLGYKVKERTVTRRSSCSLRSTNLLLIYNISPVATLLIDTFELPLKLEWKELETGSARISW